MPVKIQYKDATGTLKDLTTQIKPQWKAGTSYEAGELVTNAGTLYEAKENHVSGSSFDADSAKWSALSGGGGVVTDATEVFIAPARDSAMPSTLVNGGFVLLPPEGS